MANWAGGFARPVRYARKSSFGFGSCLWFPPFVQSRSRGVKKSRSGRARPTTRLETLSRRGHGASISARDRKRPLTRLATLASPPPGKGPLAGLLKVCENRGNEAGMYMKTKEECKKSLCRTVPDPNGGRTSRPADRDAAATSSTFRVAQLVACKSRGTKPECL